MSTQVPTVSRATIRLGEAARRIGMSRETLRNWCVAGRVRGAKKSPSGQWHLSERAIEELRDWMIVPDEAAA